MKKKSCVIVGVTASIAVYKACELVRKLTGAEYDAHVVMTPEAARLINPLIFQSLSGNPARSEMFAPESEWNVEHISLAQRADLVIVAPATTNIIAKIAHGICDDLLTCVLCATRAPVLICPAMNEQMFVNKVTQENIRRLRALGYVFSGPRRGMLACGRQGMGCLSDVEDILAQAKKIVS
jgi:phosphopantothenoylcysteine decarboxylase / phosphopantothenate---cysteine ligase